MAVVWVIEKHFTKENSVTAALIGNFPVRAFASFDSFSKLIQISRKHVPTCIVVNTDDCTQSLQNAQALVQYYLPDIAQIYVGKDAKQGASKQQTNSSCSFISEKDLNPIDFSRHVRHVIKQRNQNRHTTLRFRDLIFDFEKFRLDFPTAGASESLPLKEAQILKTLIQHQGQCVSRVMLRKEVWQGLAVSSRTIDSHVSRLRKRLERSDVAIESIYGGGYILK